jgi:hypothetical protein
MAIVRPIISGRIIDLRDHVFIGLLFPLWLLSRTLFSKWWSTNGPFLIERGTIYSSTKDYFLRPRTISLSVRLLLRVLYPLAGVPQGDTGCLPPDVLPSPPP